MKLKALQEAVVSEMLNRVRPLFESAFLKAVRFQVHTHTQKKRYYDRTFISYRSLILSLVLTRLFLQLSENSKKFQREGKYIVLM
jgi:hypothetical protein